MAIPGGVIRIRQQENGMPRKKVHKSGIDSTISDAERFPLFETLILAAEPDNDGKTESVRLDGVAIRQYAESTIAKKEAGISNRTLYLFRKAESGEEMMGAEFDELERGMRAQGLDDRAIQQQRDTYNSQRLRRRNTEAIMKAGGGALRAPDGSLQIVHPSTKNPGQYQVSRFGKSGVTGDSQFGSIEDAVRFAQGTGHTELVSGEAANDALIQAIEAESSRGAQQTEARAGSHPDPAIDGKNVLTGAQDGRVIEAVASHKKPPRGIQGFERPGGEQSQAAQKQPWQMTRAEYYLQENGPIVAAIQDAMRDGRRIELRTQYRITPLRSLDHVRLTSGGEVQIREGKGWVTLFDSQIDNLARQAGMELPPYLDRTFHINYVEEALREGKPVATSSLRAVHSLRSRKPARSPLIFSAKKLSREPSKPKKPTKLSNLASFSPRARSLWRTTVIRRPPMPRSLTCTIVSRTSMFVPRRAWRIRRTRHLCQ